MKNALLPKTAVLLFAYSPEEELRQKPLWNGLSLINDLNQNTIKQIEKSGLDYFHFSEKEQQGRNFGERFAYSIQAVFDKGYEYIITLGNDTPHLRTKHIIQAAEHINGGDFVVGPSCDGGFYMLGFSRSHLKAEELILLPWQTAKIRQTLLDILLSKGLQVHQLQVLMDLDSVHDIQNFIGRNFYIPNGILMYFYSIYKYLKPSIVSVERTFASLYYSIYFNKGSPLRSF